MEEEKHYFILGEEFPMCPHCGSRTLNDWTEYVDEHGEKVELHKCRNPVCGFEFEGVFEEEE